MPTLLSYLGNGGIQGRYFHYASSKQIYRVTGLRQTERENKRVSTLLVDVMLLPRGVAASYVVAPRASDREASAEEVHESLRAKTRA